MANKGLSGVPLFDLFSIKYAKKTFITHCPLEMTNKGVLEIPIFDTIS